MEVFLEIKVLRNVMIKNNSVGKDNRELFINKKVFVANLVSSPGAGKTTLLENSISSLAAKYKVGVIEGDLYTSRDAERLEKFNIPIVQINTEGGCHLDARMVRGAINELNIDNVDVLFIENVGNLVCPSSFDLGEHKRILVYSITEGEDKPKKYSTMFSTADVVIINKVDLSKACKINIDQVENEIRSINKKALILKVSALEPNSLREWLLWLEGEIERVKKS